MVSIIRCYKRRKCGGLKKNTGPGEDVRLLDHNSKGSAHKVEGEKNETTDEQKI